MSQPRSRIVIIGGGPGGYEAALVAAQLGADVTVIEETGLGGACVLTDCVPSKTLISTSSLMADLDGAHRLGIRFDPAASGGAEAISSGSSHARADSPPSRARADSPPSRARADSPPSRARADSPPSRARADAPPSRARADSPPSHARADAPPSRARADAPPSHARADAPPSHARADAPPSHAWADAPRIYSRIRNLAHAQSADVAARLATEGVKVINGRGRLARPGVVAVGDVELHADTVLIATGARPRELDDAVPDGERLLTSRQIYDIDELPSELIVVGSGVTGAEFASAFQALGSQVTLVSSRDHVLPNEDADAAMVVEDVFRRRGMTVLSRSRAVSARRTSARVEVKLADGRTVSGTHCLLTVGMVPLTSDIGLENGNVEVDDAGFVTVDRVSRTSAPGIYAAGDCTGVWMLASVAAMQGRIAMWHALGEAVPPLKLSHVAATIFTEPEIATVGVSQAEVDRDVDRAGTGARVVKLPLATNARAKMDGFSDGFVKLFARRNGGIVLGGVIVAPKASELILGVSLAIEQQLTVDEIAHTFAVYPSLTGSITEAARQLMQPTE